MLSDRIPAQRRHEIWAEMCELVDRLHDLTQLWWREDVELVNVHYDQWRLDDDQYELPFEQPASGTDDAISQPDPTRVKQRER